MFQASLVSRLGTEGSQSMGRTQHGVGIGVANNQRRYSESDPTGMCEFDRQQFQRYD